MESSCKIVRFLLKKDRHEHSKGAITHRNRSLSHKLSCADSSVGSMIASVSVASRMHFSHAGHIVDKVVLKVLMLQTQLEET